VELDPATPFSNSAPKEPKRFGTSFFSCVLEAKIWWSFKTGYGRPEVQLQAFVQLPGSFFIRNNYVPSGRVFRVNNAAAWRHPLDHLSWIVRFSR
jgi:hypothetical protein